MRINSLLKYPSLAITVIIYNIVKNEFRANFPFASVHIIKYIYHKYTMFVTYDI